MEYLAGLFLLGLLGFILGFVINIIFHSGGGNTGGMMEGVFWVGVGMFVSMIIFLFLGLRDSGEWLITNFHTWMN